MVDYSKSGIRSAERPLRYAGIESASRNGKKRNDDSTNG